VADRLDAAKPEQLASQRQRGSLQTGHWLGTGTRSCTRAPSFSTLPP
jgi:hypothetical protein